MGKFHSHYWEKNSNIRIWIKTFSTSTILSKPMIMRYGHYDLNKKVQHQHQSIKTQDEELWLLNGAIFSQHYTSFTGMLCHPENPHFWPFLTYILQVLVFEAPKRVKVKHKHLATQYGSVFWGLPMVNYRYLSWFAPNRKKGQTSM